MKKRVIALILMFETILALGGCGVNYDPQESGMFIKKDYSLEGAYIEEFDPSQYNLRALTAMGQEEVKTYNNEKKHLNVYSSEQTDEKLPISLDEIEQKENKIFVRMSYAAPEDYLAFNQEEIWMAGGDTLYVGELKDSPIPLEGEFVTVTGEKVQISEIMEHESYHLVYLNYKTNITLDGTIKYVSTNVNCNTKNDVSTGAGGASFIIFK